MIFNVMEDIQIRPATALDAAFVAGNVIAAMGMETPSESLIKALTTICAREDTLYSYRNTDIALYKGVPAGSLVSYDGGIYAETSAHTFALASDLLGEEVNPKSKETCPGEYYLDSLAVLPEYRGHAIGSLLIGHALHTAQGLGFEKASLIVDKHKPWLQNLYSKLGFDFDGELLFFGEEYLRMVQYI